MSKPLEVFFTRAAEGQIAAIDAWWIENRLAAPLLFKNELARTLEMLVVTPTIGNTAKDARVANVRRVLLRRTQYHLYYRADGETLVVLAV